MWLRLQILDHELFVEEEGRKTDQRDDVRRTPTIASFEGEEERSGAKECAPAEAGNSPYVTAHKKTGRCLAATGK